MTFSYLNTPNFSDSNTINKMSSLSFDYVRVYHFPPTTHVYPLKPGNGFEVPRSIRRPVETYTATVGEDSGVGKRGPVWRDFRRRSNRHYVNNHGHSVLMSWLVVWRIKLVLNGVRHDIPRDPSDEKKESNVDLSRLSRSLSLKSGYRLLSFG